LPTATVTRSAVLPAKHRRGSIAAIVMITSCIGAVTLFGFSARGAGAAAFSTSREQAQQPDGATQQEVNSFSLSPCGSEPGQPGIRPNLSYTLAPGAHQDDCVFLSNYSNVPLTFAVYGTDAFNNTAGDFATLQGDAQPKDLGAWIKASTEAVTLQPATGIEIPITIQVPADAAPGDHAGVVLASSRTSAADATGKKVLLDRRTGTRVYLRVEGKLNPGLVVENLSTDYSGALNPLDGELDVAYTIRNEGNVRLGAKQQVEINDLFGTAATKHPRPIPELLPGNSVTVHAHFSGIAATIRLSVDVKLTPIAPAGTDVQAPEPTTTTAHVWAIPWLLLVLLVLLAVVIGYARRRRRRARETSVRGGPPVGSYATSERGAGGTPAPNGSASRKPAPLRAVRLRPHGAQPP